jgi:hypothetical protein
MGSTFTSATSFVGGGIAEWDVSSVTSTALMFRGATVFNANLAAWSTVKLVNVQQMFETVTTSAFTGDGVASFNVGKVANLDQVFDGAAITSCNKKRIDDAWKSNALFEASDFGWTGGDRCE